MNFLWLILIPIIWLIIAKRWLHKTFDWKEFGISLSITVFITALVWVAGSYSSMWDTEIYNGEVTKKERIHDTYIESYSCNCRTVTTGKTTSTVCQTCYRTHYTVDWIARTTIGNITLDSEDSTSSSVYRTPDPSQYLRCYVGEPVSLEKGYKNYIKLNPNLYFNTKSEDSYANLVPQYPSVFDYYRINRVLNVNSKVKLEDIKSLNQNLNESLRTLGAAKKVNIVVILTELDDQSFRYSVENKWLGGKKNDVVVFIGLDDYKITWTDIMTFAVNDKNEMLQVVLRDAILDLKQFEPKEINKVVVDSIKKNYIKPTMEDYKPKESVDPPLWVMILAFVLSIGSSIGLTFYFHKV